MDEDEREGIRLNAELVAEQMRPLSGLAFDYDAASVEWLDGYIERQRENLAGNEATVNRLVSVLGSYLGECIRRVYGGEWRRGEQGIGVYFTETVAAFPFNKMQKQFANGSGDSVYSFFRVIPALLRHESVGAEENASV